MNNFKEEIAAALHQLVGATIMSQHGQEVDLGTIFQETVNNIARLDKPMAAKIPSNVRYLDDGSQVNCEALEEGLNPHSPFLSAVTIVRKQTGCGIREAKDFCDRYYSHLKAARGGGIDGVTG